MGITYRYDEHLEFLKYLSNEELDVLVEILIRDPKDKKLRLTQELTNESRYKIYYPNHKAYWDLIAGEYQLFGGNTFANSLRGYGVLYEEILQDVLDALKVKDYSHSISSKEQALLMKVVNESLDKMSNKEREEFVKALDLNVSNFTPQAIVAALQAGIKIGGFLSYQIAVIVVNAISKMVLGRGLSLAANAALVKYLSIFAGPIGVAITALWTAIDLAGPAYRVTIPATIYIASLRQAKRLS